jgi:NTP pyrophosphatase (non-canonical NTP hydrolase)
MRSFQLRVRIWVLQCFGREIADDLTERSFRFLEEALELFQSVGCTREQAMAIVAYVYEREAGATRQEVGGVMTTLAAFCATAGIELEDEAERELYRITQPETIAKIRRKQASKRAVVSHTAQIPLPTNGGNDGTT